jgi:hypothetical protein
MDQQEKWLDEQIKYLSMNKKLIDGHVSLKE